MELVAFFVLWFAFVVWAGMIVARAKIPSAGERILWYVVIYSMPFVGALLIWFRFGRREPKEPMELRMARAIADAHSRAKPQSDSALNHAGSEAGRDAT